MRILRECVCSYSSNGVFFLVRSFVSRSFLLFYYENNCIRTKWHNGNNERRRQNVEVKCWNSFTSLSVRRSRHTKDKVHFKNTKQCNGIGWENAIHFFCWIYTLQKKVERQQRRTEMMKKKWKENEKKRKEKQNHKIAKSIEIGLQVLL